MLFNTASFLIFFPIVVLGYFIVPKQFKTAWLLAASMYFYACWNPEYLVLLLISTLISYVAAILIEKNAADSAGGKRPLLILVISLVINIGTLVFFKYTGFLLNIISDILAKMGVSASFSKFDILLPIGISFYTFKQAGYLIDVYRGNIKAERNLLDYTLFVSFFLQLVAGPIDRAGNLLRQIKAPKKFSFDNLREGLLLMLWGFFLKMILADRITIFVDMAYGNFTKYSGIYLIVATLLFGMQIYCDFAGYSTIAIGAGKILGFDMPDNFKAPYISSTVAEFWRKWHISLTSWFKDYIYIPLGGSRKGKLRKNINRMIVFLISGLWHGSKFSFVVWGGINGLYQIVGDVLSPVREKAFSILHIKKESALRKIISIISTFILIDISWIFFRANRFMDAVKIIKSMFVFGGADRFTGSIYELGLTRQNFILMLVGIALLIFSDICTSKGICIRRTIMKWKAPFRWLVIALSVGAIVLFGVWGAGVVSGNFIYAGF